MSRLPRESLVLPALAAPRGPRLPDFDIIRKTVVAQGEPLSESFPRPVAEGMFPEAPDAHTVAIVASYPGRPVGDPSAGAHDLDAGEGHDSHTRIDRSALERYQDSIRTLLSRSPTP